MPVAHPAPATTPGQLLGYPEKSLSNVPCPCPALASLASHAGVEKSHSTPRELQRTSVTKASKGAEGEQFPRTVSLAVAKDGSAPAVTIPLPEQVVRTEPLLCQPAPLMRLQQRSGAAPGRAPACGASGLINGGEMSGEPRPGWQELGVPGERRVSAGRGCAILPEHRQGWAGAAGNCQGTGEWWTPATQIQSCSGAWTTSLWMCVTHLSTQPGVFFQL